MLTGLYFAAAVPLGADGLPDQRYHLVYQVPVGTPTYAGDVVLQGQPGVPPPPGRHLTLYPDGVFWRWGNVKNDWPTYAPFVYRSLWQETPVGQDRGVRYGTNADKTLRGVAVTATYDTDMAPHEWWGDGQ
jgi:hypothetical protein